MNPNEPIIETYNNYSDKELENSYYQLRKLEIVLSNLNSTMCDLNRIHYAIIIKELKNRNLYGVITKY